MRRRIERRERRGGRRVMWSKEWSRRGRRANFKGFRRLGRPLRRSSRGPPPARVLSGDIARRKTRHASVPGWDRGEKKLTKGDSGRSKFVLSSPQFCRPDNRGEGGEGRKEREPERWRGERGGGTVGRKLGYGSCWCGGRLRTASCFHRNSGRMIWFSIFEDVPKRKSEKQERKQAWTAKLHCRGWSVVARVEGRLFHYARQMNAIRAINVKNNLSSGERRVNEDCKYCVFNV